VIVEAVIDEQGRVTDVRILRGLPMGLDREAVAAVRQWRFTPATLQGKPVKVYFSLTVNFRIQR
jgi:protein TonB